MSEKSNEPHHLHFSGQESGEELALGLAHLLESTLASVGERTLIIHTPPKVYERFTPIVLLDPEAWVITAKVCALCVAWKAGDTTPHPVLLSFEANEEPIGQTLDIEPLDD
jgi:hypothetical protein